MEILQPTDNRNSNVPELRAFLQVSLSPNAKLLAQALPRSKTADFFFFFLFPFQVEIITKLALCFNFIACV